MKELRLYATLRPLEPDFGEYNAIDIGPNESKIVYIIGEIEDTESEYGPYLVDLFPDTYPNIDHLAGEDGFSVVCEGFESIVPGSYSEEYVVCKLKVTTDSSVSDKTTSVLIGNLEYRGEDEELSNEITINVHTTSSPEPDPPGPGPEPIPGEWIIKWNDDMKSTSIHEGIYWNVQDQSNEVHFVSNGRTFSSIYVDSDGWIYYDNVLVYNSEQQQYGGKWYCANPAYQTIYMTEDPRNFVDGPFIDEWQHFLIVNTTQYGIIDPLEPADPKIINIDLSLLDDPTTMPNNIPAKVFRELLLCKGAMKFGGIYVGTGKYKIIQIDYDGCKVNYRIPEVKIVEPLNNAPHQLIYKDGEVQWGAK